MRERRPAHDATANLRNYDSVRHAVASLFGGDGNSETSNYLQRMQALADPTAKAASEEDGFAAAEKALLALGATRSASSVSPTSSPSS